MSGGAGEGGVRRAARLGRSARGAAARRRGGVSAGRLSRGARGLRAGARGRLDQRAVAVPAGDPGQLGRQAHSLTRALRPAAPPRAAGRRHHGSAGPGGRSTVDGAGDSDGNTFVAQEACYEASFSTAVRGTLRAGWRRASFQAIGGASYGVGGQVSAPLGAKAAVQAGLGVRRLQPDSGGGTTPLTAALGLRLRPGRDVAGGSGYGPAPLDETATLIASGLVVNALDGSVDGAPSSHWSLSGGGGGAWLSDCNRRYSAVAAALARVMPGGQVGPFARAVG